MRCHCLKYGIEIHGCAYKVDFIKCISRKCEDPRHQGKAYRYVIGDVGEPYRNEALDLHVLLIAIGTSYAVLLYECSRHM